MTLETNVFANDLCVIIPAAGWGRRYAYEGAKELAPHPEVAGKSFLEVAVARVRELGARALIISRQDKHDLNDQVRSWQASDVELLCLEQTRDWHDSVLQSQAAWGEHNILLLPDTVFDPPSAMAQLAHHLNHYSLIFATFIVDHSEQWGVIEGGATPRLWEKPRHLSGPQAAWGLMAFRRQIGEKLFSQLTQARPGQGQFELPADFFTLALTQFRDLTRISYTPGDGVASRA